MPKRTDPREMRAAVDAATRAVAQAFGLTPDQVGLAVAGGDRPGFVSACLRERAADRVSASAGHGIPTTWDDSVPDALTSESISVEFLPGSCETTDPSNRPAPTP